MSRKFLTSIDLAQNQLLNAVVQVLASDPGSPVQGQIWFNSTSKTYKYYDGTSVQVIGTGSGSGNVTQGSNSSASGILKVSGGADKTITDYAGGTGLVKSNSSGVVSAATAGTDYAPATSGSGILKGNGSGGFSSASAGTDYLSPSGNGSALTGLTQSQISGLTAALALLAPLASPTFTGTVTMPAPVNSTDAATKAYVDATAQGLNAKPSAKVTATSNITLSGTQTIDGTAVSAGDRVLATGQTTASQNGLWTVASGSWTRPSDFATGSSQVGTYVFVEGGTANASSGWILVATSAVTVDTSSQTWTQFSGAGEISAGTGLAKSGNTLSIENGGVLLPAHGGTGANSLTGLIKGNGTSAFTAAVSGTDYAPATSGSGLLKGNGSGGFSTASSGTDYAPATSGSALLKGNGSGGFSSATAGTDYAAATSGTSILKGDGAGGTTSAKYAATVGDGSSTSITVTHNLGTRDVVVQVYDASSYTAYECDVTMTSTSVVTLGFSTAPASNSLRVVVIG